MAVGVSVSSSLRGSMTIALSLQQDIVEEEMVIELKDSLEVLLGSFCETGRGGF